MKRSLMIVGLVALFAILLAACGSPATQAPAQDQSTQAPAATTAPEPTAVATEAPAATGEKTKITFWDNRQTESGLSQYQQAAVDEFQKANPDIEVEVVTVPYPEYQQKLLLAVQSGNPPDVSTVDQIWNSGFAVADAIEPLDDYIAKSASIKKDNFFPGAWDSAGYDGKIGVPFNVDVWQFTFENLDMLKAAGVDPESLTTWEGLKAAGEKLTKDGKFGIGLFAHKGEDTVVVMNSFIYSNGGSVLNEDGTCALTQPEATGALDYLVDISKYAPEGILNADSGAMRELFLNGTLATEWWPALEQPTLQKSTLNWDFVNGTAPEGKTPVGAYGGWNLVMYKNSPHKEAVWKFIEFMTDPAVNGKVVDLVPANKEAAAAFLKENRKNPDRIMEQLNNARPRPLSPNYLQVSSIEQDMMQAIFSGTPVADATKAACEQIDALAVGNVPTALSKETPAAAGEKVKITFWDNRQTESGLSEFQQRAVDEFEKANPDIEVEVVTVPYPEYQQKLLLAVQSGNPPDVSTVDQIWNSGFAVADAIIPLDDKIAASASIKKDNFFPGAWDSAGYDGKIWGVPFNVDVWQFTFENLDMLKAAGVDPESLTTWEGLKAAGEKLTKDGKYGIGLFAHKGEDTVVVMNSFIYSNGGSVLNEDGTCALTQPEATGALDYLLDISKYAPEGILNADSGGMRELFLNGTLGTEWWPALEQPTLQKSTLNWDFVNGTAPEGKTPIGAYGGWNLVVYKNSPHQDAAWKFIEFMTDPKVNGKVVDLIPANKEAAAAFLEENRKNPDRIMEQLDNARPRPLSPNYLQVSSIEQDMMQAIFSGTPVADATKAACEQIDKLNAK